MDSRVAIVGKQFYQALKKLNGVISFVEQFLRADKNDVLGLNKYVPTDNWKRYLESNYHWSTIVFLST